MLSAMIGVAAALEIAAETRGRRRAVYALKPLTTSLILLLAALSAPVSAVYQQAVVAGLVCSLAGDVFLMLPSDRFLAGLASFLLAHLCYIVAFASAGAAWPAVPGLALGACGAWLLWRLWPALGGLRLPVAVYAAALLLMAWLAAGRAQAGIPGGGLAAAGAVLFVLSDSLLALGRFSTRRPFPPALVLGTYFAAQWLLAASVSGGQDLLRLHVSAAWRRAAIGGWV